VAHALLVTAYHLLARGTTYRELGADYDDRRHTERVTRRAIQTLERQGYRVSLEPAQPERQTETGAFLSKNDGPPSIAA